MQLNILEIIKKRISEFVSYRVQTELEDHVNFVKKNHSYVGQKIISDIIEDPLIFNQIESARALAIGVATTYAADIDGDIAEFGTMTGYTAAHLAHAISECESSLVNVRAMYKSSPKNLDLFDSFEGLPVSETDIDINSPHVQAGVWTAGTCEGLSAAALMEMVSQNLDPERITIYPGWFKDTVGLLPNTKKYSLIHIDGDLYISAMDVLSRIFANGNVSPGCIIFFDDWNCNKASSSFGERRAWREIVEKFDVEFSDRSGYGIFGHSFFVHDYKRG